MIAVDYNNLSPTEAVKMQQELRSKMRLVSLSKDVKLVGGADISFNKFSDIVYAGIVVLAFPSMQIVATATAVTRVSFPYIPGLLAFREIPAVIEVWNKLELKPDVLVMDGHGIAHPRRMGIATHFGIVAETPTMGCAKSLLVGAYDMPPDIPFSTTTLTHKGEKIGEVLRTKARCKPVFISPGNLITMEDSVRIIKQCVGKYRIPEPTRQAHLLVNQLRMQHKDL